MYATWSGCAGVALEEHVLVEVREAAIRAVLGHRAFVHADLHGDERRRVALGDDDLEPVGADVTGDGDGRRVRRARDGDERRRRECEEEGGRSHGEVAPWHGVAMEATPAIG
jgi:hypothetical protein